MIKNALLIKVRDGDVTVQAFHNGLDAEKLMNKEILQYGQDVGKDLTQWTDIYNCQYFKDESCGITSSWEIQYVKFDIPQHVLFDEAIVGEVKYRFENQIEHSLDEDQIDDIATEFVNSSHYMEQLLDNDSLIKNLQELADKYESEDE